MIEVWRRVWREGAAPRLSIDALEALRRALAEDDPRLIQHATTNPPPLQCVQDWPCEGACLLAFAVTADLGGLAPAQGCASVAAVEEAFARLCFEIDEAMGEPAACRRLLNFWDDASREAARRELLIEVEATLDRRRGAAGGNKP